ncbi:HPP family protein [Thiothrix nivea]|uniref:HPP family protein n=1 Tax=Thiothrix nivea (strain ATCC 35100 / DSM 5205 / JP2) TaxID=870187 RepID=A0A656HED8_THINJ|nr:HPP family protein [Thiothrix nivea]EIJ34777.1 HPP family protein [Thiothrix nivea DSM 5205]
MRHYFAKMKGGDTCHPRASFKQVMLAWAGGVLAIGTVAALADVSHVPLVLGSFGASCVLLFGFPDSPFSQPRNVIAGHFLASLTGLVFLTLLGAHWWSMALATGTAIALMLLTRTVHPPAGSNPVIVMLTAPAWQFLLTPTLLGAVALVIVALVFNNLPRGQAYPKYWV